VRPKSIYRKSGDANLILCYCPECGKQGLVEEHGRTRCPDCYKARNTMEWDNLRGGWVYEYSGPYLENIPYNCRNEAGTYMIRKPELEST
jgi:hypothetical protein